MLVLLPIQFIALKDYVRGDCAHVIEHDVSEVLVAPRIKKYEPITTMTATMILCCGAVLKTLG